MTLVWVQKAAGGSVWTLWHRCTQSVQSHKPWKVREASVCQARLISVSKKISNDIRVIQMFLFDKRIAIPQTKFGFFRTLFSTVWLLIGSFIWEVGEAACVWNYSSRSFLENLASVVRHFTRKLLRVVFGTEDA